MLISINLGILNLLPIPILDGGQALLFTVEGVKRAPLSLRTREIVQQIGLAVLMLLMGLAFWNDLSRHWSSFVDWLRERASTSTLLLAIESATRAPSASRCCAATSVRRASWRATGRAPPSERLLPAIDALLAARRAWRSAQVDAFAVVDRPGLVHGPAHRGRDREGARLRERAPGGRGLDARRARARAAPDAEPPVAALLDARRGEVYAAAVRAPASGASRSLPDARATRRRRSPRACRRAARRGRGGRARSRAARLARRRSARASCSLRPRRRAARAARWPSSARAAARAGRGRRRRGRWSPRYVRRAEAEVRRTGQRFEAL